ncbi:MAG: APC family permease, partial [Acidimicrobiia bacterium]
MAFVKRILVGRPLATTEMEHQRIPKTIALAVFSSDAISSTAYATEEILFVVAFGTSSLALGLNVLVPIGVAVAILLAIVITSYRQTIFSYPSGGGSYVVSRENLGENPSLVAGASLLVDYILTVAVSISAGVAAIVSIPAFRDWQDHRVLIGLVLIALICVANLRGIKESGRIFAVPTYVYIGALTALVGYGLFRTFVLDDIGRINPAAFKAEGGQVFGGTLPFLLLLKGFSSGAVALTGVEAISNGVPAFRRPESKNAANTLVWMGVILGTLFMGVQILSHHLGPYPNEHNTVMSQLGAAVWGHGTVMYVVLQFATAAILTLAANTAYADFPRLSSIIASDGYLPKQLANRGDRLVFSNGVLVLSLAAAALLIAFGGQTNALIPLYAVGVFLSFTLSQAGMVRHHQHEKEKGYKRGIVINAVGSVATFIVLLIVGGTKFTSGAWVPLVVIPIIVLGFKAISRHYRTVADGLSVTPDYRSRRMNHTVVVLVSGVHRGVLDALAYAQSLHPNHLVAVSVVSDEDEQNKLEHQWEEFDLDVPLEFVYSPYREMARPITTFIDELDARFENDVITVVLPEFVVRHWWGNIL